MPETTASRLVICIPVYNDWDSVRVLLSEISDALRDRCETLDVLIVDDGSDRAPVLELDGRSRLLDNIRILRLRRNVGHQRAIAVGLSHLQATGDYSSVVVMDGDGEDSPYAITKLLDALERIEPGGIVFAERGRRPVGLVFKLSYRLYRALYRLATGRSTRFGSFSAFRFQLLERLVTVSELWNHFAAGVLRARIPLELVLIDRRERIAGASKMGFVPLVAHGLSALSVFADVCAVRGLVFFLCLAAVLGLVMLGCTVLDACAVCPAALTGLNTCASWLFRFSSEAALLFFVFALLALRARQTACAVPRRDYEILVGAVETVNCADSSAQTMDTGE